METLPHNGTATSIAAAESMRPAAARQRARVWAFVASKGAKGATADEIEAELAMSGNSVRPRLLELRAGPKPELIVAPFTRATRTGREAAVYVVPGA
ncbi:MAG TPA: hypothetical protein VD931_01310 [Baekduia sp.]|nr:hypothetical protein [Baekduia sp.]